MSCHYVPLPCAQSHQVMCCLTWELEWVSGFPTNITLCNLSLQVDCKQRIEARHNSVSFCPAVQPPCFRERGSQFCFRIRTLPHCRLAFRSGGLSFSAGAALLLSSSGPAPNCLRRPEPLSTLVPVFLQRSKAAMDCLPASKTASSSVLSLFCSVMVSWSLMLLALVSSPCNNRSQSSEDLEYNQRKAVSLSQQPLQ